MDTPAAEVLVPLIFFSALFGIVYVVVSARHRQRMAMIEKGITPADMMARRDPSQSLKYGLLGVGVGIGLLLGYAFRSATGISDEDPLPYFTMVTICGGLALIVHYWIMRRKGAGAE